MPKISNKKFQIPIVKLGFGIFIDIVIAVS
jgi:hypothetical protein